MADKSRVLVLGATGQQGGAVARLLLERGHRVRALTRNTGSSEAKAIAAKGAELVQANSEEEESLEKAMKGVDAVFAVTTPFESGMDAEVRQGKTLVNAAKAVGVPHFVYSSVAWADRNTGIPHFESKWEVEKYLQGQNIRYSVLGPAAFMENAMADWSLPALKNGTLAMAVPADVPLAQIALADIAGFAALAIEQPARTEGKRTDIAGNMITGTDAAAVLSEETGRPINYFAVPIEQVRSSNEDLALMWEFFAKAPQIDVAGLRQKFHEVGWQDYRQWASKQDWKRILA